jgi:hypothetical protein
MVSASARDELFRSSVVVTGTHYSMTTLAGRILAAAPGFHMVHEPTNARPTLSYDSIRPGGWYRDYAGADYAELRAFLIRAMRADGLAGEIVRRAFAVRSPQNLAQVARYAQRKLPMRLARKRAIFKDPFLAFSARSLQREDGLKVVLTVRHPAAFAESFIRAGNGFDFADLLQDSVLDTVPALAGDIRLYAEHPHSLAEQAGLLWSAVYGFADAGLRTDQRSFTLTQEALVEDTDPTIARLLDFAGTTRDAAVDRVLAQAFGGSGRDFAGRGDYTRRDPAQILGKWRERLSLEDIAALRERTATLAETYGYDAQSWAH